MRVRGGGGHYAGGVRSDAQVRFLNINRKISALACGRLSDKHDRDLLLVGAQTTLLAYDVNENADLFFKDAPDGGVRTRLDAEGALQLVPPATHGLIAPTLRCRTPHPACTALPSRCS